MTTSKTPHLRAIKKQPAEQLTTDELRRLITTSELPPGTRITEANLSEQFQVSRGTVRIALYQLSQEGLVVQTPYTGWTVMSLRPDDLWELYTLRAALESMAAKLAAQRLVPAGAQALEEAFEQLRLAVVDGETRQVVAERDFTIHKTIMQLSGHKRLQDQYRMVEQMVRLFVTSTYSDEPVSSLPLDHHRPIVDAILRKDAEEAARLLEEHSISEGERLYKELSSRLAEDVRLNERPAA